MVTQYFFLTGASPSGAVGSFGGFTTHPPFYLFTGFVPSDQVPATPSPQSEYRQFGLAVPPEIPGPAPRIADAQVRSDKEFWALARIAEIDAYVTEVAEWAVAAGITEGDEIVDDVFDGDDDLFGRSDLNGRRKPRRGY